MQLAVLDTSNHPAAEAINHPGKNIRKCSSCKRQLGSARFDDGRMTCRECLQQRKRKRRIQNSDILVSKPNVPSDEASAPQSDVDLNAPYRSCTSCQNRKLSKDDFSGALRTCNSCLEKKRTQRAAKLRGNTEGGKVSSTQNMEPEDVMHSTADGRIECRLSGVPHTGTPAGKQQHLRQPELSVTTSVMALPSESQNAEALLQSHTKRQAQNGVYCTSDSIGQNTSDLSNSFLGNGLDLQLVPRPWPIQSSTLAFDPIVLMQHEHTENLQRPRPEDQQHGGPLQGAWNWVAECPGRG